LVVTQTVEYALRAVVWLAQHPGTPQTTQQLADATHVSVTYLPKVLAPLARAGLVSGQRGLHGGYSLERDPSAVSVLDVVDCIDPIAKIDKCPLDLASHGARLCPLHRMLNDATALVQQKFATTTIESLITDRHGDGIRPLCDDSARVTLTSSAPGRSAPGRSAPGRSARK